MLPAFNGRETFHPLEIVGAVMWLMCWVWENVADVSKHKFMTAAKEAGVRDAVLGYEPYNTSEYRLWTLCRHPNYFGEWMSWNAIIISSLPSLYYAAEPDWIKAGFALTL